MFQAKSSAPASSAAAEGHGLRCLQGGLKREAFDDEYVRRLIEGDPHVERHFFDYFSELLWIKLRSRLRDAAQIDDLRQETLLRVLTALKKRNALQESAKLGAFVNAVCNNLLFELYRRDTRQKTVELGSYDLSDGRTSAESELVTEERRREVRQVLDELPSKDRELLRLIFYEDVGREVICRSYQVDREYLRVLVHRAKGRFRELLLRKREAEDQAN